MSLRPFEEQRWAEEEARLAVLRSLGPAAAHFERISEEQVRDAVSCAAHGRDVGFPCGNAGGRPYCCLERRKAAARQAAELADRAA